MRFCFLLTALAIAGSGQAADTTDTPQMVHVQGTKPGAPMAWRYGLLQTAQATFEEYAATRAPGASLTFRLPNVDPEGGGNQVALVVADKQTPLPMVAAATFALGTAAGGRGAMVVADRDFAKGSYRHPNVQVRSPGLPEGVRRMGDLRLACAAQVAMAKAESLKFRALLASASLFGDLCAEMEVANIGAPAGPYDTMTIEDGERVLAQARSQGPLPRLGEQAWSDNARISFTLNGQIVR